MQTDKGGESDCAPQYLSDQIYAKKAPATANRPKAIPGCEVDDARKETSTTDGTIRVPSGTGYRIMTPFPWRLHEMLEEIESKRLDWIVSWLPDGKAFQVHDQVAFTEKIIPMYFRHTRYKSFQRQLYLYGFRSLEVSSISKGAYFHPHFIRENRSLCQHIVRPKAAGSPASTKSKELLRPVETKSSGGRKRALSTKHRGGISPSSAMENRIMPQSLLGDSISSVDQTSSQRTPVFGNANKLHRAALLDQKYSPLSFERRRSSSEESTTKGQGPPTKPSDQSTTCSGSTQQDDDASPHDLTFNTKPSSPRPTITTQQLTGSDYQNLRFFSARGAVLPESAAGGAPVGGVVLESNYTLQLQRLEPFMDEIISIFRRPP